MSRVVVLTTEQVEQRRAEALAALAAHRTKWTAEQWQAAADAYLLDATELALWSDYEDMTWLGGAS